MLEIPPEITGIIVGGGLLIVGSAALMYFVEFRESRYLRSLSNYSKQEKPSTENDYHQSRIETYPK